MQESKQNVQKWRPWAERGVTVSSPHKHEGEGASRHEHLHGSHIVESVVQLLADGLVLQFLSIQLVYEQEVGGRSARTRRMVKRWRVSKDGVGAIPTRQQGKGNA